MHGFITKIKKMKYLLGYLDRILPDHLDHIQQKCDMLLQETNMHHDENGLLLQEINAQQKGNECYLQEINLHQKEISLLLQKSNSLQSRYNALEDKVSGISAQLAAISAQLSQLQERSAINDFYNPELNLICCREECTAKKVLLVGFYGGYNLGDELMLQTLLGYCRQKRLQITIMLSENAQYNASIHGNVDIIHYCRTAMSLI